MRRTAIAPLAALALALPAAAPAKEGAMVSPALSALVPGQTSLVQVIVAPIYHGRHIVLPSPRDGARPFLVLQPMPAGRPLRFGGSLLRGHASTMEVTIPRGRRDYHAYVTVGHRRYPLEGMTVFTAGADAIVPDPPAPPRAAAAREESAAGVPAWPLAAAGAAAGLGLGAWWRRRRA